MTSLRCPSEWKRHSLTASSRQRESRRRFAGLTRVLYPSVRVLCFAQMLYSNFDSLCLLAIRLGLWIGNSSVRLGLMQHPHPALVRCPLRTEEIERRVYQLAASFGVQAGRPLSPHSTPLSTPGSSPPPTPRPR